MRALYIAPEFCSNHTAFRLIFRLAAGLKQAYTTAVFLCGGLNNYKKRRLHRVVRVAP